MSNRAALERQAQGLPVTRRGRHFLEFDAGAGVRRWVGTIEPLHYGAAADQEIDTAWVADTGAWQWRMIAADFEARTRSVFNSGSLIEFRRGAEWVVLNPLSLNWINQDSSTQQIATTAAVTGVVNDDAITWTNAFGTGRHFKYQAHPSRLMKLLTIDSAANLPAPTVTGTVHLMAEFQLTNSTNVDLWIDGVRWARTSGVRVTTANRIEFRNVTTNAILWRFEAPLATDAAGAQVAGTLQVRRQGPNYFASVRFPATWVRDAARVFPIVLDPTLTAQPDATAGIDTFTQSNAADTDNSTNGALFAYRNYFGQDRVGLLKFDLSTLTGATVSSAVLSLWYTTTGSGEANVTVNVQQVLSANSAWVETSTWNYRVPSTQRWAGDAGSNGGNDAGCSVSGTDYSTTVDGSTTWTTVPADNAERTFTITTSRLEAMIAANYGWALTCTTNKAATFRSSDYATAGLRPKLVVDYTTGGSPQTLTPGAVALTLAVVAPTLVRLLTLAPAAVALALAVPAPTLSRGTLTLTPASVAVTLTVVAPTLSFGAVTVDPSPVAATLSVPAPTVTPGALVLTPAPVALTLSVPAPSVTSGTAVAPDPVALTLTVPDPTIVPGALTLTPSPIAVLCTIPAPTITTGALALSPSPVALTVAIPSPTVSTLLTLSPSPVTLLLAVPVVTIAAGTATLAPSPLTLTLTIPAPTIAAAARPGTVGIGASLVYTSIGVGSSLVGAVAIGTSQGG
jgi:hypothetical protein